MNKCANSSKKEIDPNINKYKILKKKNLKSKKCVLCKETHISEDLIAVKEEEGEVFYCDNCHDDIYIKCCGCDISINREADKWVIAENVMVYASGNEKSFEFQDYCWACFKDKRERGGFRVDFQETYWRYTVAGSLDEEELDRYI